MPLRIINFSKIKISSIDLDDMFEEIREDVRFHMERYNEHIKLQFHVLDWIDWENDLTRFIKEGKEENNDFKHKI